MHGEVVSLSFLLDKLKWGLQQIDSNIRDGSIEPVMKGGQVHYKLNQDYGQAQVLSNMNRRRPMFRESNIGAFVNRKNQRY